MSCSHSTIPSLFLSFTVYIYIQFSDSVRSAKLHNIPAEAESENGSQMKSFILIFCIFLSTQTKWNNSILVGFNPNTIFRANFKWIENIFRKHIVSSFISFCWNAWKIEKHDSTELAAVYLGIFNNPSNSISGLRGDDGELYLFQCVSSSTDTLWISESSVNLPPFLHSASRRPAAAARIFGAVYCKRTKAQPETPHEHQT